MSIFYFVRADRAAANEKQFLLITASEELEARAMVVNYMHAVEPGNAALWANEKAAPSTALVDGPPAIELSWP